MTELIENIDKLHTTEMGAGRIKKNLQIEAEDIVSWCRTRILEEDAKIERRGKNRYAIVDGWRITVHAHSYTIITAHRFERFSL